MILREPSLALCDDLEVWDPGRGGRLTREGNVLTIRLIRIVVQKKRASQAVLVVKNWPANAGDIRDVSLIPGFGKPPGGGYGNPL